jgi:hypothetical protein
VLLLTRPKGKHLRYSINGSTIKTSFYRFSSRNLHCYFARCKGCTTTDTITIGQPDPIVVINSSNLLLVTDLVLQKVWLLFKVLPVELHLIIISLQE